MSNYFIFILKDTKEKESECIKMCRAILISEVIINKCIENGYPLNTSKLQKLLFYMQKEHLRKYNKPMFDESIVAWECGPAIEEVYDYFKIGRVRFDTKVDERIILLNSHEDVANIILQNYGNIEPFVMIDISKKEDSWKEVWNDGQGFNEVIPLEKIMPMDKRAVTERSLL